MQVNQAPVNQAPPLLDMLGASDDNLGTDPTPGLQQGRVQDDSLWSRMGFK